MQSRNEEKEKRGPKTYIQETMPYSITTYLPATIDHDVPFEHFFLETLAPQANSSCVTGSEYSTVQMGKRRNRINSEERFTLPATFLDKTSSLVQGFS